MNHAPDCRWELTTHSECGYRSTHHYCPHAEHACTCPPKPKVEDDLALALSLLDAHTWPPEESPCRFDHHGGCQEHGFLSLEQGEKCPTFEAHELLVRRGIREEAS